MRKLTNGKLLCAIIAISAVITLTAGTFPVYKVYDFHDYIRVNYIYAMDAANGFYIGDPDNLIEVKAGRIAGRDIAADGIKLDIEKLAQSVFDTDANDKIDTATGGTNIDSSASTGFAYVTAGVWSFLTPTFNSLSDVTITTPAQGDLLYYNGTAWVNITAGASGTFLKSQGTGASIIWDTPPGAGDMLASIYNAGNYTGQMMFADASQLIANKQYITPWLIDSGLNNYYKVVVPDLTADRNITFPLLPSDDELTFNNAVQTLTNKTLTSPVITNPTGLDKFDVGLDQVDNTSDATQNAATATLENKTLTSPIINVGSDADGDLYTRNAGQFVRIAKGDIGNVLLQGATIASWEPLGDTFTDALLNTSAGDRAHEDITTGARNASFGYNANGQLTEGDDNTAIGTQASANLVSGGKNTSAGAYAGAGNLIGSKNTFLGYNAGRYADGDGSIYIGNDSGKDESGKDNILCIDNQNRVSYSAGSLIYGVMDEDPALQALNLNATVSVDRLALTVIVDEIELTLTDDNTKLPTSGAVVDYALPLTGGAMTGSNPYLVIPGDSTGNALKVSQADTVSGVGVDIYHASNASTLNALQARNPFGTIFSLGANGQTYFKDSVGIGTTTPNGKLDSASGNTGAIPAIVVGADVGASTRTNSVRKFGVIGFPHYTNTEEIVGAFAVDSDGTDNTLRIGSGTSANNGLTKIKFFTGATDTTVSGTERMTIDSAGNVGIGRAPGYDLDVYRASGSITNTAVSSSLSNAERAVFRAEAIANGSTRYGLFGVYFNDVVGTGNKATGYINLSESDGTLPFMWFDNSSNLRYSTTASNIGTTSGVVIGTQTSDIRVKKDIKELPYGLADIMLINPISFTFKEDTENIPQVGFSAQEVINIIPEAVYNTQDLCPDEMGEEQTLSPEESKMVDVFEDVDVLGEDGKVKKDKNGKNIKEKKFLRKDKVITKEAVKAKGSLDKLAMTYVSIIPVLVNAVKEQQVIITDQAQTINNMDERIKVLENAKNDFINRLSALENN